MSGSRKTGEDGEYGKLPEDPYGGADAYGLTDPNADAQGPVVGAAKAGYKPSDKTRRPGSEQKGDETLREIRKEGRQASAKGEKDMRLATPRGEAERSRANSINDRAADQRNDGPPAAQQQQRAGQSAPDSSAPQPPPLLRK